VCALRQGLMDSAIMPAFARWFGVESYSTSPKLFKPSQGLTKWTLHIGSPR